MTEPINSVTATTAAVHSVTVTGRGTAPAAPDYFSINIGIEASEPTVRDAYAKASEALNAVNAQLHAMGVAGETISSSSLEVRADTQWDKTSVPVVTGYTVTSTLTVTLHYDRGAKDVIAAVVDTANNTVRLNGMTSVVSDPSAAQDVARKAAWADARRAAELYSQLAGRTLGSVSHVAEGAGTPPRTLPGFQSQATMTSGDSMAMEPGQNTISMAVQVTWGLH